MKNTMNSLTNLRYFPKRGMLGLLVLFIVPSYVHSQNSSEVTIIRENISIRSVFDMIEEQTGLSVAYNEALVDVDQTVSLNLKNRTPIDVIQITLSNSDLEYRLQGTRIIITRKAEPSDGCFTYNGQVLDAESKLPLVGTSITLAKLNKCFITDDNGMFSIRATKGTILEVSYLGYTPKRIPLDDKYTIQIDLEITDSTLDRVVVVGYDSQKKSMVVGAIETIKSNRIVGKPVISLNESLAGEVAGLTVMQSSGQPGVVTTSMHIRGVGTWGQSSPLVLIDGVAMNMYDVMPADVESVTVLKDAASSAIYGSRAANGVILITTKKGRKGRNRVSYSGSIALQAATRKPETVSSWQYAELYNQGLANRGKVSSIFPADRIARMKAGGDPDKLEGNTDWYDEFLRKAYQHQHNVSIEGGNEGVDYLVSVGHTKQDGVIFSSYNRTNARVNLNLEIDRWLSIGTNISYINDKRSESSAGAISAYYKLTRTRPYTPVKFSDGTWSFDSAPTNPVRMASNDYGMQDIRGDKIVMLITPRIQLLEDWIIDGFLGYETKLFSNKKHEKKVNYDAFEPAGQSSNLFVPRSSLQEVRDQHRNLTSSLTSNYQKIYNGHSFKILGGTSFESFKYEKLEGSRKDFLSGSGDLDAGNPTTSIIGGYSSYSALASLFGRFNYSYCEKYLLELNLRYDGSSKFHEGNRWGTFPSIALGYRISEEKFFEPIKKYIQDLKFRGSWGKLGNQNIKDYLSINSYGLSGNTYVQDVQAYDAYSELVLGNKDVTWEKTSSTNIGIDFTLLNKKLTGSFDWYIRNTDDILLQLETPALLGIKPSMQNAGSVQNKGWELSVAWRDRLNDNFSYSVGFNLSDVKNEITDLRGYTSPTEALTSRIEGYPIDAIYGWETLGICKTQDQYEKYKDIMQAFNPNWGIGDLIINDRDDNKKITTEDKTVIGNQIPRYNYGINVGLEYKNFDLYCLFQGVGKRDGFLGRDVIEPMGIFTAYKEHYTDSFDPLSNTPNMNAYYPRILGAELRHNYQNFSHWVQDASYLRLKNLQIGYTFSFAKKRIEKLRVALTGQNIFTITKHRIYDPENGLSTISFPNVSTYAFAINLVI